MTRKNPWRRRIPNADAIKAMAELGAFGGCNVSRELGRASSEVQIARKRPGKAKGAAEVAGARVTKGWAAKSPLRPPNPKSG